MKMAITITSTGNLIKINFGGNNIKYFDSGDLLYYIQIDPETLFVSLNHRNFLLFDAHLSTITINGAIPADLAAFETALNAIAFSKTQGKLDPLIALGFMSSAITAPIRRVTALGNNPDVDGVSLPETIWPGGGLYPWMTGATSLEAVSTSVQDSPTGTGMGAISLTLMNAAYAESSVSVTLNGTTAAPITGTWFRVNGGITTTKGSGAPATRAVNVGDIIIRDAGGGTTRAIIPAGRGILRQAVYTVPAGYSLQILSHYMGFNRGTGGATRYVTMNNHSQNSSGVARTPLDLSCNGESYRHDGLPGITIAEKTDYSLEVLSISADNSDITGAFLGILMRNDLIATLAYP